MEELIGKKVYGFKFKKDWLHYATDMSKLIDSVGTIILEDEHEDEDENLSFRVEFNNGETWSYPYPEILDHLVEDERTIDQIIIQLKQLTSRI